MEKVAANCIETVSGRYIDLLNPTVDQIDVADFAWALSRMPRYAGHTLTALPYTVGQHSIVVTGLIERLMTQVSSPQRTSFYELTGFRQEIANYITPIQLMHGLMHDASEGYLLDLPTPLKNLPGMKEAYGAIEDKMMRAIWQKLGLAEPDTVTRDVIKWADRYALTVEAHHLMKSRGTNWTHVLELDMVAVQDFELPTSPIHIYQQFMQLYDRLGGDIASMGNK